MPFDISTAQPVKKEPAGFDLGSGKPSRNPKVVATEQRRKKQIGAHEAQMQADRDENETSLGGIVHGTIEGLKELNPIDATVDYFKDYGKGIATSLEEAEGVQAEEGLIGPGDVVLGAGAPIIEYPLAMVAGAVMAPFRSGDYGTERDLAFKTMDDFVQNPRSRAAQGSIGSLIKPVGDLLHTSGEGIGKLTALAADDPGAQEAIESNVGAITEDVLGFAGVKAKAPRGTPVLNPGPPKRQPVTPGVTADPVARARDAGYHMPASARTAEGKPAAGVVARTAETVSGKSQNAARVDQLNDQRVLEGIRKDLGLPKKAAITKPAIDAIMSETGKVYDSVSKALPTLKRSPALEEAITGIGAKRKANPLLKETPSVAKLRQRLSDAGDVETQQVLNAIEEFRADARLLSRNAEKPEALQRAKASREAADVLENALDEALTDAGRPGVIPSLKNARVRRAKAHQALEVVSGKKRPGVALMDMDQAGEALTGEMKLAADVHRDFTPGGTLGVNQASGAGQVATGTTAVDLLQGVARPIIQPILNSEFGQSRMFGPRVPESLSPYEPRQFDVPPPEARQAPLLGPGVDLEPGPGSAGGAMPSDTRRLNSTIAEQLESQGSNADLASQPGMPGRLQPSDERRLARTTEQQNQIRLQEFDLEPPPSERRLAHGADRGGAERRADIIAERQAVLERQPAPGMTEQTIADQLLSDPRIAELVRQDTIGNRDLLNPGDALPVGGTEPGVTRGPIVPETGEFARQRNVPEPQFQEIGMLRSNADIGDMIGNERVRPATGEVTITLEELQELGFSPEEIAQILGEE